MANPFISSSTNTFSTINTKSVTDNDIEKARSIINDRMSGGILENDSIENFIGFAKLNIDRMRDPDRFDEGEFTDEIKDDLKSVETKVFKLDTTDRIFATIINSCVNADDIIMETIIEKRAKRIIQLHDMIHDLIEDIIDLLMTLSLSLYT